MEENIQNNLLINNKQVVIPVWIASILVALIGFFLHQIFQSVTQSTERNYEKIHSVQIEIEQLKGEINSLKQSQSDFNNKWLYNQQRVDDMSNQIQNNKKNEK